MQSQSHIFSLQFPLCHKHYQLSLFFVEKNNTLKKFVAGSSTEFAMVVWFAVPGETRATVRYIVFTRATVLTPPVKVTSLVSQGLPVVGGEGETGYTIRQQQSLGVVAFSAFLI